MPDRAEGEQVGRARTPDFPESTRVTFVTTRVCRHGDASEPQTSCLQTSITVLLGPPLPRVQRPKSLLVLAHNAGSAADMLATTLSRTSAASQQRLWCL